MFTVEKVYFPNPLSAKRADSIEYMLLDENKQVMFGEYSSVMQQFYDQATQIKILHKTNDLEQCLKLLRFAYMPIKEQEYLYFVNTFKRWKDKPLLRQQKIHNYHNGSSFYILPPEASCPKSSNSIFHRYLCRDTLPNDDENIDRIREIVENVLFDIKYDHYTYIPDAIAPVSYHNDRLHGPKQA